MFIFNNLLIFLYSFIWLGIKHFYDSYFGKYFLDYWLGWQSKFWNDIWYSWNTLFLVWWLWLLKKGLILMQLEGWHGSSQNLLQHTELQTLYHSTITGLTDSQNWKLKNNAIVHQKTGKHPTGVSKIILSNSILPTKTLV